MKQFITLPKLIKDDQVAIISPSMGIPGLFPWVYELGISRINKDFGLKTIEYPTTRQMNSSLEDRARDIMAAFSDQNNKAVIASIGGEDQIQLLKFLDKEVFLGNLKPFFGYSDNTHLHNYLWNLGIPSYYGGSVMTQYAMQTSMHDFTVKYLNDALFESGFIELESSSEYTDTGLDWTDKTNLNKSRMMEPNDGWFWDGDNDAGGILWGGCVESLIFQIAANKYLPTDDDLEGAVLFLETAEDIPEHWIIERLLIGFGERGWLSKFSAVVVGRPKAWELEQQNSKEWKKSYSEAQRKTVIDAIRQYNKTIPIVQNLDFGHTDPQIPLPMGRVMKLDSKNKIISVDFS